MVYIYTDGCCEPTNPGPGAFGSLIVTPAGRVELAQAYLLTTNNRMELMGVIRALEHLDEPSVVTLVSDSQYVVNGIAKGWVLSWKRRGWIKADQKPVLNRDLWERILELITRHRVTAEWVKGHAGHPENERCDEIAGLAVAAAVASGHWMHDDGFQPHDRVGAGQTRLW